MNHAVLKNAVGSLDKLLSSAKGALWDVEREVFGNPGFGGHAGGYANPRAAMARAEYMKRFEAAPAKFLDAARDAPGEYHDGLTVAKTFALAIDEAAKLHPAAEPLIVHAALLAPEPIPLFLFAEGRETLGEPLAALLAEDGLDEAVAALRTFALVDREAIPDEREPEITTECIRLHRLVRQVAAARLEGEARENAQRALIETVAADRPRRAERCAEAWRSRPRGA